MAIIIIVSIFKLSCVILYLCVIPGYSSSIPPPVPSASTKREAGSKRDLRPARVKGRPRSAESKFELNDPKWPHMWYLVSTLLC